MLRSFLLLLLCCCPILSAEMGPSFPPIKGARKASTAPYWETYGIQAVLRDVPGAVVIVEDTLPEILPHPGLSFFHSSVSLKSGEVLADPHVVPMPDWLNPGNVMANGNVAQRSYNLLGLSF